MGFSIFLLPVIQQTAQLSLPLDELGPKPGAFVPRPKRIFCNRNLRMTGISWVGFDMDYTLAIYDQPAMDRLSIEATVKKLVARGYPEVVATLPVPIDFPVRGLLIDKRFGHVLKMDRYKQVAKGFHGTRELTKEELRSLYHAKKLRPATPRYHWIDTLYALSEVALYSAVVETMEKRGMEIEYAKLFMDIRECIDEAHRDGTILDAVASDLPRFVHRDPDLAPTLHKLRSAGKKLFLLTNSRWAYTEKMMTHLLGGAMTEYPSWRNFFDVVIAAATKPAFFTERRPLMERTPTDVRPASFPLERGRIYEGGNVLELERALAVSGDQILYVGDHIYGDILRSKKESVWRTAMIIQELETEVIAHEECKVDLERTVDLEDRRGRLEDELRFYQARFKELSKLNGKDGKKPSNGALTSAKGGSFDLSNEAERNRMKRAVERVRGLMRQTEAELAVIERRIDARFHPYWGSLLKEANEQSSFGAQVEEYACLYTSRVSNLQYYSPQQHFRSPRDVMAHEMGTSENGT
ncbi:HAD-IG family 5'-nucleotidase [soil metagenome]